MSRKNRKEKTKLDEIEKKEEIVNESTTGWSEEHKEGQKSTQENDEKHKKSNEVESGSSESSKTAEVANGGFDRTDGEGNQEVEKPKKKHSFFKFGKRKKEQEEDDLDKEIDLFDDEDEESSDKEVKEEKASENTVASGENEHEEKTEVLKEEKTDVLKPEGVNTSEKEDNSKDKPEGSTEEVEKTEEELELERQQKAKKKEKMKKIAGRSAIAVVILGSFMFIFKDDIISLRNQSKIKKAIQALDTVDSYLIFNNVSDGDSVYSYLDSKVGKEFYSEDEDTENAGYYYLSTWTREDGTTYSYGAIEEDSDTIWNEYPSSCNEVYTAAKYLDVPLYLNSMQNVKSIGTENLDLGLESNVDVDMYSFDLKELSTNSMFKKKATSVYKGILSYIKKNNESGKYDEAIKAYEKYIEDEEATMTFSGAEGKIGIYDGKLVVAYIQAYGGGSTLTYSKMIGYDSFEKRETPNFEEDGVTSIAEAILRVYYDEKNEDAIEEVTSEVSSEVEEVTEEETEATSEGSTEASSEGGANTSEVTEASTETTTEKVTSEESVTEKETTEGTTEKKTEKKK